GKRRGTESKRPKTPNIESRKTFAHPTGIALYFLLSPFFFLLLSTVESQQLLSIHDYHRAARAKLPKEDLDYFEGGALDEMTLRENTAGWEQLKLYYHVLAGIGERDLHTTILGQSISMPI